MAHQSEPVAEFIQRHAIAGKVAYDVGANQGLFTDIFLKLGMKVHAFEPNNASADILENKHSGNNDLTIHRRAVLDFNGSTSFYLDQRPNLGGVGSSIHALSPEFIECSVPCLTLDSFAELNKPDPFFIKIDVEGAEWKTIQGAKSIIERSHPYICFEFWQSWWTRGIKDIFDILHPSYDLIELESNQDAWILYADKPARFFEDSNVFDIGCIPRRGF